MVKLAYGNQVPPIVKASYKNGKRRILQREI